MSEVKRWEYKGNGVGFLRGDDAVGHYVYASDYDAKCREVERLTKVLERIADKGAWDEVMELKRMASAALAGAVDQPTDAI